MTYLVLKKDEQVVFHRRKEEGEEYEELGLDESAEELQIVHVRHRKSKDGSQLNFLYTASVWDHICSLASFSIST